MGDRKVVGTVGWTRQRIVLDVAEDSQALAFGVLLVGTGRADVANLSLATVDWDVPVIGQDLPTAPRNLDFAQ